MRCKEKGCKGTIDTSRSILVSSEKPTHSCSKCGRLHSQLGVLIFAEGATKKVFLDEDGQGVLVNKVGEITRRFPVTITPK